MTPATRSWLALAVGTLVIGFAGPAVAGDPERGRAVFEAKFCDRCHRSREESGPGPALEYLRRPQGQMELAGRLWNHVPAMFTSLTMEAVGWPAITVAEMDDLMSFLRADPARDPAPDVAKGHLTLVRKGWLKCHSLRREGGPVRPDLAERRSDYESAAAWAVTMWTHAPGMAQMAARRGLMYPHFTAEEMVNLVGLLRSAGAPDR
jgi:hypothetical protein